MIVLVLILFFHFFIGFVIDNSKTKFMAYFFGFISLMITLLLTWGIKYTADTEFYKVFYEIQWEDTDLMYFFLTKKFNQFGFSYFDLYKFYIVTYILLHYYLISRFNKNVFYIFLVYFILNYVQFVNQIRYYMAFPLFLLSLYFFIIEKKIILAIIFTMLAFISHSAIALLYVFVPMFYFLNTKSYFKTVFVISGIVFLIVLALYQFGLATYLEHFGEYFNSEMTSSFLGGLFNALPSVVYIIFLYILDKKYRMKYEYKNDKYYQFISKLSFFTVIFIPSSFFIQVLCHRYVFPFLIIWVIHILYIIRNFSQQKKMIYFFTVFLINIFVGLLIYFMPSLIINSSFYYDELSEIIKSIDYLNG